MAQHHPHHRLRHHRGLVVHRHRHRPGAERAIVRALEQMARQYSQEEGGALACVAECLLQMIRQLIEYFNKWAFTYVGIYGYDFITAGKSVIALFKERGWTAIINDDLIDNALSLATLGVGAACAVVAGIVVKFSSAADGPNSGS